MSALFTDTITLYNYARDNRADVWHRTVLSGVQYTEKRINSTDATGKSVFTSAVTITVPASVSSGGKRYVCPAEFKRLEDRSEVWTLDPANGNDIVIYGECPAEISDGYTIDDLQTDYGYVSIQSVSDNTRRRYLKNWKAECV